MGPLICQERIYSVVKSEGLSTEELANWTFWYQTGEKDIYLCRLYTKRTVEEAPPMMVDKQET